MEQPCFRPNPNRLRENSRKFNRIEGFVCRFNRCRSWAKSYIYSTRQYVREPRCRETNSGFSAQKMISASMWEQNRPFPSSSSVDTSSLRQRSQTKGRNVARRSNSVLDTAKYYYCIPGTWYSAYNPIEIWFGFGRVDEKNTTQDK